MAATGRHDRGYVKTWRFFEAAASDSNAAGADYHEYPLPGSPVMRISAIVDARFSVIVDGISG